MQIKTIKRHRSEPDYERLYQAYEGLKALNERRKNATKEDTDRMLMNVDPMGNPMP